MKVIVERCAFLDVHRDTVMACVRGPGSSGGRREEVAEFATTTAQLLALSDWLNERQVMLVGMEATGVYWKPVHWILEGAINDVWVINARHMRNVPGRKTDVADAQWGAQLLEHGLVRPSFIPIKPFRQLRDLTRYRRVVIEERGRESQRLHKVLEDAGVKLSSVASRVLTKSGREMIDALIAGQRDPEILAEMAKGRMRAKIPRLQEALVGRFDDHHALLCKAMLGRIDQADATITELGERIDALLSPYEAAVTLLVTIPGVARRSAEVILAEIGTDMSRFPTAGHLASWAGMCPGNNESAGKHRSGATRHGSKWLHVALVEAAHAASRTKNTYLAAQYAQIRGRRGSQRAAVAVGHSILVICWHLLSTGEPYNDLGNDYFEKRRNSPARQRRLVAQLEAMGHKVTLEPAA
ncbi:MAG: IS110 family transposase [Actinomycetota bacterium]